LEEKTIKLLIAGDYFIADNFKEQSLIDTSIKEVFNKSDFNIINLESPVTKNNHKNRILKTGPHLRSDEESSIPQLKQLNIDLVTLSNNHIMDYGSKGLEDTLQILNKHDIQYVGAGKNKEDAAKIYSAKSNGVKIAILNYTESEWSVAHDLSAGANPLDLIDNIKQIQFAKQNHDKVIVIIHGGHEYYSLPSPRMVKQYRFYADNGADIIIGHHPHCIGGYEIHNNVPIFYSLGNFLFTMQSENDDWYQGIILELVIESNKPIEFLAIPISQDREKFTLSLAGEAEKEMVLDKLRSSSQIILDSEKLEQHWQKFVEESMDKSIYTFSPFNYFKIRIFRSIVFRLKIYKLFINESYLSNILNKIRCEAHYDLIISALKHKITSR
jgi:poly-gamma-glutamate capsule biosynthesis protein CapA/YwtB (metallophosphatase superfamily)